MTGSKPHTVLFLDHSEGLGGAEFSLLSLLKHMDPQTWRPIMVCPEGQLADRARAQSLLLYTVPLARLRRNPRQAGSWGNTVRSLHRIIRAERVEAVYANTVRSAFYGAAAARTGRVPLIWHMRDFWMTESEPDLRLADSISKAILGALSARIIANSEAVSKKLPFPRKITVVHNGIEAEAFSPPSTPPPPALQNDLRPGSPVVGMAGRLRPWKGQGRFLELAVEVLAKRPDVRFLIAGGTPFGKPDDELARLHRLASDLGIRDSVIFTGHLEDVRPALAALDVFVHPGDPEPFGRVNIEAMALEKPVVAFAHGALPEIVVSGETGILVSPGDVSGMAAAVLTLLDQPELGRKMGLAGSSRVKALFTAARMTSAVEAVLEEVLS